MTAPGAPALAASASRPSAASEFAAGPATLVGDETPRRLADCLAAMVQVYGGERRGAVCRELTKKFEEVRRGTLDELATQYAEEGAPKGEIVIVVGPPLTHAASANDVDTALRDALKTQSVKDAAREVAEALDLPRKQLYARALELTRE